MLIVSNNDVRHLIDGLALTDKVKTILNNTILRYDHSYVNFVYSVFSVYTNTYVRINGEYSLVTPNEGKLIHDRVTGIVRHVNYDHIFIADKYDVLFGTSCTGELTDHKFTHYFYEDMYSRLEHLIGVSDATQILEDIFESMEYIIRHVEANIIRLLDRNPNPQEQSYFSIYLEIINDRLVFVIIDD